MDKKLAGLLGTVGAIAAALPAGAAPLNARQALQASSYADLLTPIPNAVEVLRAADSEPVAETPAAPGLVQDVQYYHHHHHHRIYRRRYYHHHHHHHHHRRPAVVLNPR